MIIRSTLLVVALVVAVGTLTSACSKPEPRTVREFLEDEIALTGTLARCESMGSNALQDEECRNARRASERLAAQEEERERQAREAEFERKRAALRERQDRERMMREAAEAEARAVEAAAEEQKLLGNMTFEEGTEGATVADSDRAGSSASNSASDTAEPVTSGAAADTPAPPGETMPASDAPADAPADSKDAPEG